ncbi:MAG TPA: LysM peptidoglycan-binding domain-containing protein [Aggregatilineales bacterium]|nr:LysM peptidoglycan-binding domain-containing protein [Aggregatilineales bacterium]
MQNRQLLSRVLVALAGLVTTLIVGLFSIQQTGAQGTNLLQNPGFEGDYATVGGDTSKKLAANWSPWFVPHQASDQGFANLPPLYQQAENPKRVHSGSTAQEYFTFYATHRGGVFQRVPATVGTKYHFSIWVNVWSTELDDANLSQNPGHLIVRVGIDPQGGTDGTSANIVWQAAPELYDQYQQVSVEATAQASFITVFTESAPRDPKRHNNTYVDDASLVVENGQGAATTAAPTAAAPTTSAPTVAPTNTIAFAPTQEGTIVATALPPSVAAPTDTPPPIVLPGPSNTPLPLQPTLVSGTPVPAGSVTVTVAPGDTLSDLATRYGTTVDQIAAANGIDPNAPIFVGQTLIIPIPPTATSLPATLPPVSTLAPAVPSSPVPPAQVTPPVLTSNLSGPTVNGIGTYIVQAGDDFKSIADHYGVSVDTLAQLNGIVNPNGIPIGTVLAVPGPGNNYPGGTIAPTILPTRPGQATAGTHVVAPGENLFRISLKYNVTLQALMQANGIVNPNLIYVGQVLRIP